MNTKAIQRLRSKIEVTLSGLEAAAANTKSELRTSSEVSPNAIQDELDSAKADVDLKTTFEIHNHNIARQILLRNALARMEIGTFGLCHSCGDEIDSRRIEAVPEATLCIECQCNREYGYLPATRSQAMGVVASKGRSNAVQVPEAA